MMIDKKSRIDSIQVWRGIAVFIVIYYHYANRIPPEYLGMSDEPILPFHYGKLGVLIFFVISGYLIAKSLKRSRDLATFYAKRISRIWPLFILASITIFLFLQVVDPPIVPDGPKKFFTEKRTWVDLIGSIFFLEDIGFRWIDGVFWSVLVELKFYFWIGLLAYFRPRSFVRDFSVFALCMSTLQMAFALSNHEIFSFLAKLFNGFFIAQYLPFFAIGALLYTGLYTGNNKKLLRLLLILAFLQQALKSAANPDLNMQDIIVFSLVLGAIISVDKAFLHSRIFLHVGHYSYSFYLFHQLIGLSLIQAVGPALGFDIAIVLAFIATYTIAVTASYIAEWRFYGFFFAFLMRLFSALKINQMLFLRPGQKAL